MIMSASTRETDLNIGFMLIVKLHGLLNSLY